jgi:hypothetical protein
MLAGQRLLLDVPPGRIAGLGVRGRCEPTRAAQAIAGVAYPRDLGGGNRFMTSVANAANASLFLVLVRAAP